MGAREGLAEPRTAAPQLRSGTVQIFNAAGAPLGKFLWDRASRLVAFGWTEQEVRARRCSRRRCVAARRHARLALTLARRCRNFKVLLCVGDDGGVFPYSVDGELLPWQLSMGAECAAQRVADACVLPTGVVVLTQEAQLFAVRRRNTSKLRAVPATDASILRCCR
jgi:hypothetical protein